MATLNWTEIDSDGILSAKGKQNYYAIIVRGIPIERPDDCILELYVSSKELTISKIKHPSSNEKPTLVSRIVVLGNLKSELSVAKASDELKEVAERKEAENPYTSISSAYSIS